MGGETEMRAAVYEQFGDPQQVLKVVENYPVPPLGDDEVMVHVHAAALNPVDWKLMKGIMGAFGPKPPKIPGFDASGTVIHAGRSCQRLKAGDEVFLKSNVGSHGTLAECVSVPESCCALKPKNISHQEAASLPLAALTSYQALFHTANLKPGQKLLVIGGSGGTGCYGVQLGRVCGAHVTATCSSQTADLVRGFGANEIIDYKTQVWGDVLAGRDFDVIYDTRGGPRVYEDAKRVLKRTGHLVTIAGDSDHHESLGIGSLVSAGMKITGRKIGSWFGGIKYDFIITKNSWEDLTAIKDMVERGQLKPVIDKVYPLNNAREAFQFLMEGHAHGKVVLTVADGPSK